MFPKKFDVKKEREGIKHLHQKNIGLQSRMKGDNGLWHSLACSHSFLELCLVHQHLCGEVQYTSSAFRSIETSLRDFYHHHVKLQCDCFIFKFIFISLTIFTFLRFSATELRIRRQNFTVPSFHVLFYRIIKIQNWQTLKKTVVIAYSKIIIKLDTRSARPECFMVFMETAISLDRYFN